MQASFRPLVIANSITLLHHGAPPKPLPATFDDLIRAGDDSTMVTVHAIVRAADLVASGGTPPVLSARLQLLTEGGHFEANVNSNDDEALKSLLDSEVEITGAAAGKFDDKMQQTGVVLYVPSLDDIRILKHAAADPWTLPVTPMDRVLFLYHMNDLTPRVRIQGTITYYQPGSAIVLQDGRKSMWIATHTREPMRIGDRADATGFPEMCIRDSHVVRSLIHDGRTVVGNHQGRLIVVLPVSGCLVVDRFRIHAAARNDHDSSWPLDRVLP